MSDTGPMVLWLFSVDQNASEKHIPSVEYTFSLGELEAECIKRLPIQTVQCIVFD